MARSSMRWIPVGMIVIFVLSACSGAVLDPGLASQPTAPAKVVAVAATPARATSPTPAEYLRYAEEAYAAGDMEQAITYYTEVIRHSPRDAIAHYRRGLAHHGRGDLDRAISDYDVSLQINNGTAAIYCDRGLAYSQKGNEEKAKGNFLTCEQMASDRVTHERAIGYLRERGIKPL